jgi:hypothetical protein
LRKRTVDEDDEESDHSTRPWWWRMLLRRPGDTFAFMVATAAAGAIVVNASWLQHGPHPAPIFSVKPLPVASADSRDVVGLLPRTRPAAPEPPRHDVVADKAVEKPRPPAAIATPHKDAIADLLAGQQGSQQVSHAASAAPTPPAPIPNAPTRSLGGPSRQVLAVQRALSDYGYGQIKPSGVYDADTKLAIQRFERDRRLPITGEISERVTRELATLTGREIN